MRLGGGHDEHGGFDQCLKKIETAGVEGRTYARRSEFDRLTPSFEDRPRLQSEQSKLRPSRGKKRQKRVGTNVNDLGKVQHEVHYKSENRARSKQGLGIWGEREKDGFGSRGGGTARLKGEKSSQA